MTAQETVIIPVETMNWGEGIMLMVSGAACRAQSAKYPNYSKSETRSVAAQALGCATKDVLYHPHADKYYIIQSHR